jgi:glutathione peroxidase
MKILLLLIYWLLPPSSIYDQQFTDIDGNTVSMNQFQGKRILLVNIATGSERVNQLNALQQLHQQHGDSIVVIGFASNSFGNEARSNAEIKQYCQSNYNVSFYLAQKNSVTGESIQSIYNWLTHLSENGMMNQPVNGDFQKFLIDGSGKLIGVFAPSVDPSGASFIEQVTGSNQ